MLGPQVTHKRHLAGSTRIKSSSPTIKGRPFPVCLLLSLAQVRPVTIASAIPASPSRRVSHAAFSYSGRYCAITFQSTKVSPLPYRVTNKFGYKKSRGFSKSSRTRRCDSTHRRDKARHRPWPVTAHGYIGFAPTFSAKKSRRICEGCTNAADIQKGRCPCGQRP